MLIEQFDQLGKVRQRAGQTVDLVDNDDVDFSGLHVLKQSLQRGAVGVAPGETSIVIFGPDHRPAGMLLAPDIGLRGTYWRSNEVTAAGLENYRGLV